MRQFKLIEHMIEKYVALNRALRSLHLTARNLISAYNLEGKGGFATESLTSVMLRSLSDLKRAWPSELNSSKIGKIEIVLKKNDAASYLTIVNELIPDLENSIDEYYSSQPYSDMNYVILDLLHPRIITESYSLFKGGRFRDAVLNSIVSVFDLIRERTGIDKDGAELLAEAFSLQRPYLVLSTLDNESGRNDQKGFIQILQGLYQGVRNPKAHTLTIDSSQNIAAQYLIVSSLLCRRVDEAQVLKKTVNTPLDGQN